MLYTTSHYNSIAGETLVILTFPSGNRGIDKLYDCTVPDHGPCLCHLQTCVGISEDDGRSAFLDPSGHRMAEQGHMEGPTLGLGKLHKQVGGGERMGRTEVSLPQWAFI